MTERQRKTIGDALLALGAGAKRGKRMVDAGAPLGELARHAAELEGLVRVLKASVELAAGAEQVLEQARHRRTG